MRTLFALGSILFATPLFAQITPHSALKNFRLPKFNENSYRAYTLSGAEGIYDAAGFFEVNQAELTIYSGDAEQTLRTRITTDFARFDLTHDTASGDSVIEVHDSDFYLRGRAWTLDMENQRITIEREGTIRLYQELALDLTEIF